jgi:uncharacterized protein (DUF2336 family)
VRAPDGQAGRIGDEGRGKCRSGLGTVHVQLAHMRQVEQADALANGSVLLDDRAVLDRHQPATEFDQPRPEIAVRVGQRSEMDGGVDGIGHEAASASPVRASARAAFATRFRSVSKVSNVAAVSKPTQRTSSNS